MSRRFLTGTATLTNGSKTMALGNDSEGLPIDASYVTSGSHIELGNNLMTIEGMSGTLGEITLAENWAGANQVAVPFVVTYTIEGLVNAVEDSRIIRLSWIEALATVDTIVDQAGDAATTLAGMQGQIDTANSDLATIQGSLTTDLAASAANALAAQTAETNVALLYDNFDDRNLGAYSVDPLLDNDGEALQIGASYWNDASNSERFYNGAAWADPSVTATQAATSASASAINTANDAIQTALDRIATGADKSATNADAIATGNDVTTTNADAATSTTQAGIATAAAGSANDASNVAAATSNFGGLWSNLSGLKTTPLSMRHGDAVYMLNNDVALIENTEPQPDGSNTDFFLLYIIDSVLISSSLSKADVMARIELSKLNDEASGFVNMGRHYDDGGDNQAINQGLYSGTSMANRLQIGRTDSLAMGDSKTGHPVIRVNGITKIIRNLNTASTVKSGEINLPAAPDGTKTYDPQATPSIVQHASAAEAFEGLITNGDLRNGTAGWTAYSTSSITVVNNEIVTSGAGWKGAVNSLTSLGITVRMEVTIVECANTNVVLQYGTGANSTAIIAVPATIKGVDKPLNLVAELTSSSVGSVVQVYQQNTGILIFSNVSVMPTTESVITSRADFLMIESWHEGISNNAGADGFKDEVCFGGLTQSGLVNPYGITSYTRSDGYTRLGEWDSITTGEFVVWSTMTTAEKLTFLQDTKNNTIYYDPEAGRFVEIKSRARVIEGFGGDWLGISAYDSVDMRLDNNSYVRPRGSSTSVIDLAGYVTHESFNGVLATNTRTEGDLGVWTTSDTYINAHNGLCFAIPVCTVEHRNQGAKHPSFNPNGCATLNDTSGASRSDRKWNRDEAKEISSQSEAFGFGAVDASDNTIGNLFPFVSSTAGSIARGATLSGRDDGKFFDAIYASDVTDKRFKVNAGPLKEIEDKANSMAALNEIRGAESVPFTKFMTQTNTTFTEISISSIGLDIGNTTGISIGDFGYTQKPDGTYYRYVVSSVFETEIYVFKVTPDGNRDRLVNSNVIHEYTNNSHKQAKPTATDIIGDPANILALFTTVGSKLYGADGIEGRWLSPIPDGVIDTWTLNRKNSNSTYTRTFTIDSGISWTSTSGINMASTSLNTAFYSDMPATQVMLIEYETQAHFTEDDMGVNRLTNWSNMVSAINNSDEAILTSSLIDVIATGSDPKEELFVTKMISGIISHTAATMAPDVLYATAIGELNGVLYLMFNCDIAGVIDGSNIKVVKLPYFYTAI